ncbi:SPFH domain-containing protein [Streptomyces sp. NPDC059917]|uniref:SPFH domain-containing protein n=1 Tax=Streptomyces sp. NPDC059917 TaxID=3347002 RepID=UPI00366339F8
MSANRQRPAWKDRPVPVLDLSARRAAARPRPAGPPATTPPARRLVRPAPLAAIRERTAPAVPGWIALVVGSGCAASGAALLWPRATGAGRGPEAFLGPLGAGPGRLALVCVLAAICASVVGGLLRVRAGEARTLSLFGRYRGTVRRTGLVWVRPLLRRRRIDVRLRHWRSEPMAATDARGVALHAVVLVVWQVKDTARARFAVRDHAAYLRAQVESTAVRVLSRRPVDAGPGRSACLRDTESVAAELRAELAADCAAVGIEVYSAQPTRIEYAPEFGGAMRRRVLADLASEQRERLLATAVDSVRTTVELLDRSGVVDLDDTERKTLVADLTVALCAASCAPSLPDH